MVNGRAMRRRRARQHSTAGKKVGAVAITGGLLVGCGGGAPDAASRDGTATTSTITTVATTTTTATPTTTVATTTTTAPTTTMTSRPAPPPGPAADGLLQRGETGTPIRRLQQKLSDLGYWLGPVDGTYGLTTQQAVMAFQKNEGLARDGVAGPETRAALDGARRPQARSDRGRLIEIDLQRQLMLVVEDGRVVHALNTSTGRPGWSTPTGRFTISRAIDGWRHAPLGDLYRPRYFNRGIALHGSTSVPGYPASHGCTRLSLPATDMLWASGRAATGTPVWVY